MSLEQKRILIIGTLAAIAIAACVAAFATNWPVRPAIVIGSLCAAMIVVLGDRWRRSD